MRMSDWSSDVCSSDLEQSAPGGNSADTRKDRLRRVSRAGYRRHEALLRTGLRLVVRGLRARLRGFLGTGPGWWFLQVRSRRARRPGERARCLLQRGSRRHAGEGVGRGRGDRQADIRLSGWSAFPFHRAQRHRARRLVRHRRLTTRPGRNKDTTMARVTGIGGVFLKSKGDGKALAAWYQQHLGIPLEGFGGAVLRWPDDKADDEGLQLWHVADRDTPRVERKRVV